MMQFETYFLLFTDVLLSNFAFNFSNEVIFESMQIFGNYNRLLMIASSMCAYTIITPINYYTGKICYRILKDHNDKSIRPKIYDYLNNTSFLVPIILFSVVPFWGKYLILFAGFARLNFRVVFFISIIAKVVYYMMQFIKI